MHPAEAAALPVADAALMSDEAQRICVFCLVGDCDLCVGRDGSRWCECGYCPWIYPNEGD